MTPLLDRPYDITAGVRHIHENTSLSGRPFSRQTGLRVSCCQSAIAGYPWGMEEVMFAPEQSPAQYWGVWGSITPHMRCDDKFCFIDMR